MKPDAHHVKQPLLRLQDDMLLPNVIRCDGATCSAIAGDAKGGGGRSRALRNGGFLNRRALISHVHGDAMPASATAHQPEPSA